MCFRTIETKKLISTTSGLFTSIIRFAAFPKKQTFVDGTCNAVDLIIWTQVETGVYLISARLMTYRPLRECVGERGFRAKKRHRNDRLGGHSQNDLSRKPKAQSDKYGFCHSDHDDRVEPRVVVRTDITIGQNTRGDLNMDLDDSV